MITSKAFPGAVITTRRGASHAIGTIIDGHLADADVDLLYSTWDKSWPEPLGFPGGVKGITCEQVIEVGEAAFIKAFSGKKNKEAALRIYRVAVNNAGR